MAYNKAEWDYRQANLDDAVKVADGAPAKILNATDPNLKPFAAHGGKLLLYHGWNDPAISALNSVDYYNAVSKELGNRNLRKPCGYSWCRECSIAQVVRDQMRLENHGRLHHATLPTTYSLHSSNGWKRKLLLRKLSLRNTRTMTRR